MEMEIAMVVETGKKLALKKGVWGCSGSRVTEGGGDCRWLFGELRLQQPQMRLTLAQNTEGQQNRVKAREIFFFGTNDDVLIGNRLHFRINQFSHSDSSYMTQIEP